MSFDVEWFIKNNIELMSEGLWDEVYTHIHPGHRAELTKYLWEADIHPEREGLTRIPGQFARGLSVSTLRLPSGIVGVGAAAFKNCADLKQLYLGDGVTFIGMAAFNNCLKLNTVSIPGSVERISHGAFQSCVDLYEVEFRGTLTQWNDVDLGNNCFLNEVDVKCLDGWSGVG